MRIPSLKTAPLVLVLATSLFFAACSGGSASSGGEYPTGPITMVIPYGAGGSSDASGRALAKALTKTLGTEIVVKNRPGASGVVGATAASQASPDGYTLLYTPSGVLAQPDLRPTEYDRNSFDYVYGAVTASEVLVVPADSPIKNAQDLKQLDSAKYGISGVATVPDMDAAVVLDHFGVDATSVPFDSSGAAAKAVVGGQVDVAMAETNTVLPFLKSGKLRALTVITFNDERLKKLPDTPTATEIGLPTEAPVLAVWGVAVPAGVEQEQIKILRKGIQKAIQDEEYRKSVTSIGFEIVDSETAANFESVAKKNAARSAEIVNQFNLLDGS